MNNIINSLGYEGQVTARLSIEESPRVNLHNAGFKALWDLLAKAIMGYDVSSLVPNAFMVVRRNKNTGSEENCLVKYVPFTGKVWGDIVSNDPATNTTARFTAAVTKKMRVYSIESEYLAVLKLVNINGELITQLAEVVDTSGSLASIHNSMISGVDAIYEWNMIFKNVQTTSNN